MLWQDTFTPTGYSIRYAGIGQQQWYWPLSGMVDPLGIHKSYFQINIDNIQDPWPQKEGEVYWLVTQFDSTVPQIGWKTADLSQYPPPYTGNHYLDDAVFYSSEWNEIFIGGVSRDLAFVITPEPGALVLLATAVAGLLSFAWRLRK